MTHGQTQTPLVRLIDMPQDEYTLQVPVTMLMLQGSKYYRLMWPYMTWGEPLIHMIDKGQFEVSPSMCT